MIFGRSAAESIPSGSGAAYSVEVRTQPHVIDAGDLGDVVDVIDQALERWAGDFGGPLALDLVFVQIGDRFARRL